MISMEKDGILIDELMVPWPVLYRAGLVDETVIRIYIERSPKNMEDLVWTIYRNHMIQ